VYNSAAATEPFTPILIFPLQKGKKNLSERRTHIAKVNFMVTAGFNHSQKKRSIKLPVSTQIESRTWLASMR
jgi:hypothetical protein